MLLLGEWILLLGIVGGYTTAMIRRAESRPADDEVMMARATGRAVFIICCSARANTLFIIEQTDRCSCGCVRSNCLEPAALSKVVAF